MGPGPLSGGAGAGTRSPAIYLLDTNILIYLSKNPPPQVAELLRRAEGSQRREATPLKRRATPISATVVSRAWLELRSSSGMSSLQARMGKW